MRHLKDSFHGVELYLQSFLQMKNKEWTLEIPRPAATLQGCPGVNTAQRGAVTNKHFLIEAVEVLRCWEHLKVLKDVKGKDAAAC